LLVEVRKLRKCRGQNSSCGRLHGPHDRDTDPIS
jgi:hypothetical protein